MPESDKNSVVPLIKEDSFIFSVPTVDDGKHIWKLIKETGALDLNSSYSYLLWAKYFAETSVVVKANERVVGFISGFTEPTREDTIFIWQVAVDESMRGKGLALKMLQAILSRKICRNIRYLEATITPSNMASIALFRRLACDLKTECNILEGFAQSYFPGNSHEAEDLFRIGPFSIVEL